MATSDYSNTLHLFFICWIGFKRSNIFASFSTCIFIFIGKSHRGRIEKRTLVPFGGANFRYSCHQWPKHIKTYISNVN